MLPVVAFIHVHLPLFHHVQGSAVDYVGVAVTAFASWAGLPGPGETALIAAAIFASKHKLDITPLLFWASLGATAGGVAGWVVGLSAGRRLLTVRGPLHGLRIRTAKKGEEMFRRVEVLAVLLTPSWVAGINHSRARVYLPTNTVSAVAWALGIGLGAYYAGPVILDLLADVGTAIEITLGVLVAMAVLIEIAVLRRRRHRSRSEQESPRVELQPGSGPGHRLERHSGGSDV